MDLCNSGDEDPAKHKSRVETRLESRLELCIGNVVMEISFDLTHPASPPLTSSLLLLGFFIICYDSIMSVFLLIVLFAIISILWAGRWENEEAVI